MASPVVGLCPLYLLHSTIFNTTASVVQKILPPVIMHQYEHNSRHQNSHLTHTALFCTYYLQAEIQCVCHLPHTIHTTHFSLHIQFASFTLDCQVFGRCFDEYTNYFLAKNKRLAHTNRACLYMITVRETFGRSSISPRTGFDSDELSNSCGINSRGSDPIWRCPASIIQCGRHELVRQLNGTRLTVPNSLKTFLSSSNPGPL